MAERELYALLASPDELYLNYDALHKIGKQKGFVGVHPDPLGRFIALLFDTPLHRNYAYNDLSKSIQVALCLQNAMVDEKYLK